MATIYWASDSTVQYNDIMTYPQTGIGQVLGLYLKPEVCVSNHAKNGRSTKSFIEESRLAKIENDITKGDFLFIEFGHNDEKKEDPLRYTEPDGTYKYNLKQYINVARNKQAYPVLITPLERCHFVNADKLEQSAHEEYAKAMIDVGSRLNVPVIDLWTASRKMLEAAGESESISWFMPDYTHLQYKGAVKFAGCIAEGLCQLGNPYKALLLDTYIKKSSL